MTLRQDLKRSPDGMRAEAIRAGEYDDGTLPARTQEITLQARLVEHRISAKNSKAVKEKEAMTSKRG